MKKYNKSYYTKLIIVNFITSIRLFACFIIPIIFHYKGASITAVCVLFVFLTDTIDGTLARKLHIQTFLGSLLDSVSDKLFAFVSFFILGLLKPIMFVPLILEVSITLINIIAYKQNRNVKSSIIGKGKTVILACFVVLSFVLIGIHLFNLPNGIEQFLINNDASMFNIFTGIIVGGQLLALTDYSKKALKDGKIELKEIKNKKFIGMKELKELLIDTDFYMKNKDSMLRELIYK